VVAAAAPNSSWNTLL